MTKEQLRKDLYGDSNQGKHVMRGVLHAIYTELGEDSTWDDVVANPHEYPITLQLLLGKEMCKELLNDMHNTLIVTPSKTSTGLTFAVGKPVPTTGDEVDRVTEVADEDKVVSDEIEQGDNVMHAKYGSGVVEKMIKYGTKELYSINFDNVGRRLLDPTLTEIKKA